MVTAALKLKDTCSLKGEGNGNTHSSILAWRIPGTEEPGGLPSVGLHRVGHDWCDLAAAAAAPWKKCYDQPRQRIKKQRHYFANKGPYSQSHGFSSCHVWMWEFEQKGGWALKNCCLDMSLNRLQEMVKDGEAWHAIVCGVSKSQTQLGDWTTTNKFHFFFFP